MTERTEYKPPVVPRWKRAWVLSCLFHVGAVVVVLAAIQHSSGGAASESGHDIGIVLERETGDKRLGQSDSRVTQAVYATTEAPAPPALLVAEPVEMPAVGQTSQATPANAGSSASGAQAAKGAQANSGKSPTGSSYGPSSGNKATVHIFGVQGVGTKFVYVFDRSSSMEGAPLAAAKQQLIASLNSLDTIHQFQIIFFNHQTRTFDATGGGHRVAFATERNKQMAAKFVGGITADGGTDRLAALRAAVAMQPDVIFFLTDDDDPMPESELAEVNQLNRRASATICTIQFGQGPAQKADNFLVQLARLTGGQYGYVDTTKLAK
jgi:hypothetical protein